MDSINRSIIGLIAVRGEATALLKFVNSQRTQEQIQTRFHIGSLSGHDIVLAEVGPGKVQTAAATQYLIDHYKVGMVISCGSAGALESHLQIGDVILAEKTVLHDAGIHLNKGFRYLGIYDNTKPDGLHYRRYLPADPSLLATAQQAASAITWAKVCPSIKTGCLVSGDQIIASERKKSWLVEMFKAVAVEMESGAMAQVAFLNNIPWLAIRAISDQADSILDFGLEDMITYSDETSSLPSTIRQKASKVTALARQPSQVKALMHLRQAVKKAAHNAARVTAETVARL